MAVALEGFIRDFAIADIIQFLKQQNKTGILTIDSKGRVTRIFFNEGKIAWATTPETQDPQWVARFLVETDRISSSKIDPILAKSSDLPSIENELLNTGDLSEEELREIFDIQTKEAIFALFRRQEGKYSFEVSSVSNRPSHSSSIEVDFLLLEGMRQLDEWPFIEKKLPSRNAVLEKTPELVDKVKTGSGEDDAIDSMLDAPKSTESIQAQDGKILTPEEMVVYQFIDGVRTLNQLIKVTAMGAFNTCRSVVSLMEQGVILSKGEKKDSISVPEVIKPKVQESKAVQVLKSPRLWSNLFVVAMMLGWIFTYIINVTTEVASWVQFSKVYKNVVEPIKMTQIKEGMITYYLKTGEVPEDTLELMKETGSLRATIDDFRKEGLFIRKVEGGLEIGFAPTRYQVNKR